MDQHSYCSMGRGTNGEPTEITGGNMDQVTELPDEDDDFDILLVKAIENHPVLYKGLSIKEKNSRRDYLGEAWASISAQLEQGVDDLKFRYVRLRQYYAKERSRRLSGNWSRKEWRLYDCMAFMDPYIKRRKQLRGKKFFRSKVAKTESQASASDSYPVEDGYDSFDQDEISVVDEKVTPAGGSHELEEFKIYLNSSSDGNLVEQKSIIVADVMPEKATTFQQVPNSTRVVAVSPAKSKATPVASEPSAAYDDEDEENNALANLVVQRLKKIKDANKRDILISRIINVLYRP